MFFKKKKEKRLQYQNDLKKVNTFLHHLLCELRFMNEIKQKKIINLYPKMRDYEVKELILYNLDGISIDDSTYTSKKKDIIDNLQLYWEEARGRCANRNKK